MKTEDTVIIGISVRLVWIVFVLLAVQVRPVRATLLYMTEVPNASCTTCHVQNNVLDTFGTAVQAQLQANGAISWAGLFLRDSDNDTYSNGEELGDPLSLIHI